jgi:hypothetical protein
MRHVGSRLRPAAARSPCPRRRTGARLDRGVLAAIVLALAAGCAAPVDETWRSAPRLPYRTVPPPDAAPFVHCNDRTGHRAGEIPWIFGGTCLCNPSIEVIRDLRAHGASASWTVDTLSAYYRSLGVATVDDHRDCNNLCASGPHLRKGGRCLVPPTPGTLNWEEVVTGEYALPPWDVERVVALGGPLQPRAIPGAPLPPTSETPGASPGSEAPGPGPGPAVESAPAPPGGTRR